MKILLSLAVVAFSWLQVVDADARDTGFITDYSEWKSLSANEKRLYAMGMYDSRMQVFVGEMISISIAKGLTNCGTEIQLSGGLLAEAIDAYYANKPERWNESVKTAFYANIIEGLCLKSLNIELPKHGLKPWKLN